MPPDTLTTPLIGRGDELRSLAGLVGLDDTPATTSAAILLGGDAGAGKSRLVAELSTRAVERGWRVLVGHCLDFGDGSPPYLPFSEALGRLANESPELADALTEASPEIGRLLPARRMMHDSDAGPGPTQRATLVEALHGALTRLAGDRPLLLIVEDVHWADQSTRDLLRWLFTRQFDAPVAILATYRSDDLHRRHPLRAALAEWVRLPRVSRLQLDPLSRQESRQLVSALRPATMTEPDLQHILARAEGNPFFIEELVAATEVSSELPTDLADLLLVRLEQLGDDARLAVRAASVAGRRVSHELLACGTDLDDSALELALRAAVDANILVALGQDGYAFRHALLAEAVYQDLLPGERVRLHAAYADALTHHRAMGSAAELSRHARASHDLVTATRASVEAGREAMSVGGPEEAIRHDELALELLADPRVAAQVAADPEAPGFVDRVGLVLHASMAASAAGHLFRAVALAHDELQSLPDDAPPKDRVRLIHAVVTTALVMDTRTMDVLSLTTEGVRLMADEPPSPLRANILYVHARANADRARDDEAARWATEALQIARELDLAAVATDATLLLAKLDERAGDPQGAQASIEAAIAEARAAHENMAELRGLYHLASLHYGQGRVTEALSVFEQAGCRASLLGRQWAPYGLEAMLFAAIASHVSGDWEHAEELLDLDRQSPPEIAEALLAAVRLDIAAGRGETAALAAMPRLREQWQLDGLVAVTSGGAAIELYGQVGDVAMATAVHDDVVETVTALWQRANFHARVRLGGLLLGRLASAAATATAPERAGLVARGDELATTSAQIAATAPHNGPEGIAWIRRVEAEHARLHWLAGIAAPAETELVERWRASVAAFEAFGHVYETARSRARLAAVLYAGSQPTEAKAAADAALEVAVRLGARPLVEEIRALTPGEPAASERGLRSRDPEALTPRERDVLALVATGRSNREIAQQLFISAKTVSVHISNLMAKLDASSRTEAVAIARRTNPDL